MCLYEIQAEMSVMNLNCPCIYVFINVKIITRCHGELEILLFHPGVMNALKFLSVTKLWQWRMIHNVFTYWKSNGNSVFFFFFKPSKLYSNIKQMKISHVKYPNHIRKLCYSAILKFLHYWILYLSFNRRHLWGKKSE